MEKDIGTGAVEATHHEHIEDNKDAQQASAAEHAATFLEALKESRKAVMWSAIIGLTIIMEGYDVGIIYQFFAYPSFKEKFGQNYPGIGYQISSAWQAGFSNGGSAGIIIGGFANGFLSARYGYKKVILVALFFMNWLVFIPFFAPSAPVLLVGQIMCGLTWGVFATSGPAYASEVCPLALRGYLCSYTNLCWVIGQLIAAGILYGLLKIEGEWAYRIAYAVQWIWPIPLFCIILFAPESPWYLVRKDRIPEAHKALCKLDNKSQDDHNKYIAQIRHTMQIEESMESGTNYLDCFKGVDLRRTEVICMTFAGQILSGAPFAYGPTYFFEQAGISTDKSYGIATGGTGIAFIGTILSWFLLGRFGRRTLYLSGMCFLAILLLLVGIIASASTSDGAKWGQAVLCLIWLLTYSLTVGPICYTIISETSSMHLRAKSVCLSRNIYNMTQIIANVIQPYLMNPTEANLKGKAAYFWFGTATLTAIWAYFRLPECRGRTYEELDILFHRKISARKFSKESVDAYDNELTNVDLVDRGKEQ